MSFSMFGIVTGTMLQKYTWIKLKKNYILNVYLSWGFY